MSPWLAHSMPQTDRPPWRPPRDQSHPALRRACALVGLLLATLSSGCVSDSAADLRQEIRDLRGSVRKKDNQLVAQKATIDELQRRLDIARSLKPEDLKNVFHPQTLRITKLSGGYENDGQPGDDGVAVYLQPIDADGDVLKVAGDIRIQLYDLAADVQNNLIGEYLIPVDQIGKLWHGKLMTHHFSIKCPWPGAAPKHPEITIRATFVDYLTERVVSAQSTCQVKLPPD